MVRQAIDKHDDWSDCTPGTIGQLHDRLVAQRKRRLAVRAVTPLLVVMLLGMGVWSIIPTEAPSAPEALNFGGVTCSYVQANMQPFAMHTLKPAEQKSVAFHLEQCSICQEIMKAMRDNSSDIPDTKLSKSVRIGSLSHRAIVVALVE